MSDQQLQDFTDLKAPGEHLFRSTHDGVVHNPLGAAAYIYEKAFAKPLLEYLGIIPSYANFPPPPPGSQEALESPTDSAISLPDDAVATTPTSSVVVHIGAQPNNSPHAGTIVTFAVAILLARQLQDEYCTLRARARANALAHPSPLMDWADDFKVVVQLDLVDTAPDSSKTIVRDGITYQRSHRSTGAMNTFLQDYYDLLTELTAFTNNKVAYRVEYQETLMRAPAMRDALRAIILDRERIEKEVAPERERLAIRSACPVQDCGIADKHGMKNVYEVTDTSTRITFFCPEHGPYTLELENPDDRAKVELNTPLRNLARAIVNLADTTLDPRNARAFPAHHPADINTSSDPTPVDDLASADDPVSRSVDTSPSPSSAPADDLTAARGQKMPVRAAHMRVTGSDYSGIYQEQLFFRQLALLRPFLSPAARAAYDTLGPPVFAYAPLVLDWSGAKLSKSLYVKRGAYAYLDGPTSDAAPGSTTGRGMAFLL